MRLAAVILQGPSGATQEFTADHDGWDLTLAGSYGTSPGGRWTSPELAEHVVGLVLDTIPAQLAL